MSMLCRKGTLIYWNTAWNTAMSGLIKAKVVGFHFDQHWKQYTKATIKITGRSQKTYRQGEEVQVSILSIYPRECFRKKRGSAFTFYMLPFEWRFEDDNN